MAGSNLCIRGAGRVAQGIDLLALSGVDPAADAHQPPFRSDAFQLVECDAVVEHVRDPERVMRDIVRVLAPERLPKVHA